MKIAVVGSGIAGLVSAYRLQAQHRVTLFEASDSLGGHALTVDVPTENGPVAADVGFLVYNPLAYPNFVALLDELGIRGVASNMSFSVRSDARDFEYSGATLSTLYAQRRRLVSPRFHRMVWDILRFYREAPALLQSSDDVTLTEWLRQRRFSRQFWEDHLKPMLRAVWSAGPDAADSFPARFLVRFFQNHGFLQVQNPPGWLTIPGGSRAYVSQLASRLEGPIHLSSPVTRLDRTAGGVRLNLRGGNSEHFDHAVVACHADQALKMLAHPSDLEREILSQLKYQPNDAVLHADERLMPKDREVWASWNVHLDDEPQSGACITYWLNSLQPLNTERNFFLTLNRTHAIDHSKILRSFKFAHPIFNSGAVAAQARHEEIIDYRGISYCGAYWRNGFHEDGVVSALPVIRRLCSPSVERAA